MNYQYTLQQAAQVSLPWERLHGKNILVAGAGTHRKYCR